MIRAFSEAARERLSEGGWNKRAGEIYTLGDGDFIGWLGLNRATKHEALRNNRVVGVRYQSLERHVAVLTGVKPHAYITPTLSSPIGYLRPENKYLELAVASVADAANAAQDLVQLVAHHGERFIAGHSSVEAVREALAAGRFLVMNAHAEYRLPTLHGLVGDHEAAEAAAASGLARRGDRTDEEAVAYRTFVTNLRTWLHTDP
jgi:hypothetical protein